MKQVIAHILKLKPQLLQKIKQKKGILTSSMEATALRDVELLQEESDSIIKLFRGTDYKHELGKLK